MQTLSLNPTPTVSGRFPLLLETREHELHDYAPADIWRVTYVLGPTVDDDYVETDWTLVAAKKSVPERGPNFTPSGEAAYVRGGRAPGLMVGSCQVVAGPVGEAAFSLDGQLAYTRDAELWLAQADGSQARRWERMDGTPSLVDLTFSAQDSRLWYAAGRRLWCCDPATGTSTAVVTRQPVERFALAPDGRSLAYFDSDNRLRGLALESGNEKLLTEEPWYNWGSVRVPGRLAFSPDGSRILYSVTETQWDLDHEPWTEASLWALPRTGGSPTEVLGDALVTGVATPVSRPITV